MITPYRTVTIGNPPYSGAVIMEAGTNEPTWKRRLQFPAAWPLERQFSATTAMAGHKTVAEMDVWLDDVRDHGFGGER